MNSSKHTGKEQTTYHPWPRVRLGDVCNLVNGDAYKSEDWKTAGVPIIRIQNLNDPDKPFNYWDGPLDRRVVVRDGDVLLAWSGTPGTSFGTHLWERGLGVLNQHIFRVDLDHTRLDRAWAVLAINEQLYRLIDRAHGGVGLRHVTRKECDNLQILAPPLPEQRRIAARLKDQLAAVEQARAHVQAQLAEIEQLPAAFLRDVFESPTAKRWPILGLGALIADSRNGLYKPDTFYGSGTRILKMFNIGRLNGLWVLDRVDLLRLTDEERRDYALAEGDILLNRVNSRELVGKCAVVNESVAGAVFESKNIRLRLDRTKTNPRFVATWLNSAFGRAQMETRTRQIVGQATLNRSDLEALSVPLPPLPEQDRIATQLRERSCAVERIRVSVTAQLAELEAVPNALLREAFAGAL